MYLVGSTGKDYRMKPLIVTVTMVLGCLGLMTGCDQLTREHYNMITVDVDTQFDVDRIIGEPNNKLDNEWLYERVDKHLVVKIEFGDGGVVTRKEWIDAAEGVWDDSEQAPTEASSYESTQVRTVND